MRVNLNRNYYRILQISPDAPEEVIQQGYQKQLRRLQAHRQIEDKFWNGQLIEEAYQILCDKNTRNNYNQKYLSKKGISFQESTTLISHEEKLIDHCCFCKEPYKSDELHKQLTGQICEECHSPLSFNLVKGFSQKIHNHRKHKRHQLLATFEYYTYWPSQPIQGHMLDISPCGISFSTTQELEHEQIIKIKSDIVDAIFQVGHIHKIDNSRYYKVGGAFLTVQFKKNFEVFISKHH